MGGYIPAAGLGLANKHFEPKPDKGASDLNLSHVPAQRDLDSSQQSGSQCPNAQMKTSMNASQIATAMANMNATGTGKVVSKFAS